MSTKTDTVTRTFRMSATYFRELPANLAVKKSRPVDYVDDLISYTLLFDDPAIGELVWRITQANRNNGSGNKWQALHYDELVKAMRVESLNPTTHAHDLGYDFFGLRLKYKDNWGYYLERAKNDLIANRDLKVYQERFFYPSARLLHQMEPLHRVTA